MQPGHVAWIVAALAGIAPGAASAAGAAEPDLNELIQPYSTQRIVDLDLGETYAFVLGDGARREVKLVSVDEHRDTVVGLVRRATVRVELDGDPLDLVCEPYQMPVESAGVRMLVDSTAGWGNTPKCVQLSLWDARDPIVDTSRFGFPLAHYALFSHGTQAYGEPVHLGAGDDDPAGQCFYHDYGFDNAGFEGVDEVVSPVEGEIVHFWPSREDLCSVVIADPNGFAWELAHLCAIEPEIVLGAHVRRGQRVGTLGRTGPSGNFAHLHLGTYKQLSDAMPQPGETDRPNRRLNLYPWLVAAYQAEHPRGLRAVARPHHLVRVDETVRFEGSHCLAWGGSRIASWRWEFPDGVTAIGEQAEHAFDAPGAYIVTLRVTGTDGAEEVDFCQVKVYPRDGGTGMPHIFLSATPTVGVRPGVPVRFRLWMQGATGGPISVTFDDGARVEDCGQNAEFAHAFETPGVHTVSARCEVDGMPIEQRMAVRVEAE